ncbi:hypothetical protein D9M68_706080 [compost metagenome]
MDARKASALNAIKFSPRINAPVRTGSQKTSNSIGMQKKNQTIWTIAGVHRNISMYSFATLERIHEGEVLTSDRRNPPTIPIAFAHSVSLTVMISPSNNRGQAPKTKKKSILFMPFQPALAFRAKHSEESPAPAEFWGW